MNLIVDIGNTRTKVARVEQGRVVEEFVADHSLHGLKEASAMCDAAIVSSVAAEAALPSLHIPVLTLSPATPLPIGVEYGSRNTLGADRVAAAVGAWRLCPDCPCLVIDSGTCITIDLVLPERGFVGGNISAGIEMRLRACHQFTGRLPHVDTGVLEAIESLGTNTEEALRLGALTGVKHELEGYVRHFSIKYPNLALIITGGAAFRFDVPRKVHTFVRPNLVVEGLDAILEYNKSK